MNNRGFLTNHRFVTNRRSVSNRGFVLPLVLLVIVIISLLAITSQHMVMGSHLADKERSYYLSIAALEAGKDVLDQVFIFLNDSDPETYPKREKAPEEIAPVIRELLDDEGFPRKSGAQFNLESPLVDEFIESMEDDDIQSLDLSVTLYEARPFHVEGSQTDQGFQTFMRIDPREATYTISVISKAVYRETPSTTCLFTEMKLVNITPPVLGKFAVILKRPGTLQVNFIKDSRSVETMLGAPFIIKSGSSCGFDETMTDDDVRDLIDAQGWIYLGGDQAWEMNLSKGGGRPDYQDPLLKTYKSFNEIPQEHELSSESQGGGEEEGEEGQFSYYAFQTGLYQELQQDATGKPLALLDEREAAFSSILNLAGSEEETTPTMVLGKVIRKWACIQGLYNNYTDKKAVFPYLDEATFYSNAWPGNWSPENIETIRSNFGSDGYDGENGYTSFMSFVASQPYNHGNQELTDYEAPEIETALVHEPASFPPGTDQPPVLKRIKVDQNDQPLHTLAYGSMYTLLDTDENIVFKGASPGDIDFAGHLEPKHSYVFPTADALFRFMQRRTEATSTLRVSGVVKVASNLTLRGQIQVLPGGGGIILVEGNIEIRGRITAPADDPLILVSISGNILVDTPQQLDCALVALNGTVRLPENFHINGLLAADRVIVPRGNNSSKRELVYNRQLDPTNTETYRRNYRLMVKEEWNQIVK